MKLFFLLFSLTCFFATSLRPQVVTGRLVIKNGDCFNPYLGMVSSGFESVFTDDNGYFTLPKIDVYHPSISILLDIVTRQFQIVNLPLDVDTIKFQNIEMIESPMISPNEYDSIRNLLIDSWKEHRIILEQRKKADSILSKKYKPIYCWSNLMGYFEISPLEETKVLDPLDNRRLIKIEYDKIHNVIQLDYNKLHK